MEQIFAKNISKFYKDKQVLKDITLEFGLGEIVGLLGPNGAGKTTFFYGLLGLVRVTSGSIFVGQVDITKLPMHERAKYGLAYLPQENSIFRDLNVEDNIAAILEIKYKDKAIIATKLTALLKQFGLESLRKSAANALSGGERRRVEIARCLALEPKFIFLDEPFAGVDPIAVQDIMNLMIDLKKQNIGILITDHNVRETLKIVDRAYIIYDGVVLIEGDSDKIINDKKVREIYLGENF
ncbi:MAG: LPS export ABC transporter ATP-binding protein [Rickettsiales bacterium]|jgi:lipopolysaccharide export system ATP-binding protein|nr:LPS export ABC transporter ATP-binding protein [Rickettsiales bacterium]